MSDELRKKQKNKIFLKKPIDGIQKTLMVSSAKGGVGKSTVAINLACAFKKIGLTVGYLDADIYGPSLPKLINNKKKPETKNGKLIPVEEFGIKFMSMGFLVNDSTPMIWRGPMVISAIKTLTEKVLWGDLDIMVIDMPPGTGDAQLTFAQDIKIDGAVIVSTPQDLALVDVERGIEMFEKTELRILGLIENMSFLKTEDGKIIDLFGKGGVEKISKKYNKQLLAQIPIHKDLRVSADVGRPIVLEKNSHEISKIFIEIAKKIKLSFD